MIRILTSVVLVLMIRAAGLAAPVTIRVLTYNIHHGEGRDREFDVLRQSRVIISVQPDLVALQEVDVGTERSSGVNQVTELARSTGMFAQFGKAIDYMGGDYGVAVLSRWPFLITRNQALPGSPQSEPRTALTVQVRVDAAGPVLQFTSTHFDQASPEDRLAQAEYVNELLVRDDVPGILAGDMNARPDSEVMKIFQPWWTEAPSVDPAPATASLRPALRGDHILFRPAASWRPIESRFIDETVASDHRPLLVVLEWIGGAGDQH
jgi:endonuclease/exonuclease/phosphatase family metal-dependent hydrolase